MSRQLLTLVDIVIAVGADAPSILRTCNEALGQKLLEMVPGTIKSDEIMVWFRHEERSPMRLRPTLSREERHRHRRKYAEGSLGEDKSFYFRGLEGKLQLRAQNLVVFSQLAQGVDDDTWMFHRRRGDYSHWFREAIEDESLAKEAESIERDERLSARESRKKIQAAIEHRYTLGG